MMYTYPTQYLYLFIFSFTFFSSACFFPHSHQIYFLFLHSPSCLFIRSSSIRTYVIHVRNIFQHFRTKHIEIRHHFIQELIEDGTLTLEFIHIDDQKANLFTKPLDSKRFEFLHQNIGVISMD